MAGHRGRGDSRNDIRGGRGGGRAWGGDLAAWVYRQHEQQLTEGVTPQDAHPEITPPDANYYQHQFPSERSLQETASQFQDATPMVQHEVDNPLPTFQVTPWYEWGNVGGEPNPFETIVQTHDANRQRLSREEFSSQPREVSEGFSLRPEERAILQRASTYPVQNLENGSIHDYPIGNGKPWAASDAFYDMHDNVLHFPNASNVSLYTQDSKRYVYISTLPAFGDVLQLLSAKQAATHMLRANRRVREAAQSQQLNKAMTDLDVSSANSSLPMVPDVIASSRHQRETENVVKGALNDMINIREATSKKQPQSSEGANRNEITNELVSSSGPHKDIPKIAKDILKKIDEGQKIGNMDLDPETIKALRSHFKETGVTKKGKLENFLKNELKRANAIEKGTTFSKITIEYRKDRARRKGITPGQLNYRSLKNKPIYKDIYQYARKRAEGIGKTVRQVREDSVFNRTGKIEEEIKVEAKKLNISNRTLIKAYTLVRKLAEESKQYTVEDPSGQTVPNWLEGVVEPGPPPSSLDGQPVRIRPDLVLGEGMNCLLHSIVMAGGLVTDATARQQLVDQGRQFLVLTGDAVPNEMLDAGSMYGQIGPAIAFYRSVGAINPNSGVNVFRPRYDPGLGYFLLETHRLLESQNDAPTLDFYLSNLHFAPIEYPGQNIYPPDVSGDGFLG